MIPSGTFWSPIIFLNCCQWSTGSVEPSYDSRAGSLNLFGTAQVWMCVANGDSEFLTRVAAELPPTWPMVFIISASWAFISDLSLSSTSSTELLFEILSNIDPRGLALVSRTGGIGGRPPLLTLCL
ncbi:hypothetical protein LguiA_028775 [Lonicera macranthoides]